MQFIIDFSTQNYQYIYAISFWTCGIVYFIKLMISDFGSDDELIFISLFISAIPVVNTFLVIWFICKYTFLFFKKNNDKKKERLRLENESFKSLYNDLKSSLIISGRFQDDEEINEFLDSIKLSSKLSEN